MKALHFTEHGERDVIRYGEVPDPAPGIQEVLVRVRACAINHLDIWVRKGWPGLRLEMPHWCGADVAGEVAALGGDVSSCRVGDSVVVDPGITGKRGVDVVVDNVGRATLAKSLQAVSRGGRIVIIGNTSGPHRLK